MNRLIEVQTHRSIELTRQIASSGEGSVWRTNCSGLLAKVYHQPSVERIQKLEVMLRNPPEEMLAHIGHTSYAWPVAILENEKGQRVGFLMPEIKQGRQLTEIYNPSLRKRLKLEVDWQFLHTTAYNFALLMESIHRAGYVIGDVKPENILVNPQALPSIIDTDSFQVRDPQGHIYRCPVGSEGFTPPELIGKNFKEIDQTEVHDRFRLGVIVFTLLFGYEPFKGVWKGGGEPPELNEWVKHNYWPYSGNGKVGLADYMMPLDIVHPELQNLFLRCFNDGYSVPAMRPSAREWRLTLGMAIAELQVCSVVDTHLYHRGNSSCCWCERTAKGLPDIFLFNRTVPRVISEPKSQSATVSHSSNKTPTAVSHLNRTVPRVISEPKSQSATVSHSSNKTPTAVSHLNRTVPRVISEPKSQSATVSHSSNKTPTAVSHHTNKTTNKNNQFSFKKGTIGAIVLYIIGFIKYSWVRQLTFIILGIVFCFVWVFVVIMRINHDIMRR
jgi:serine/threonine protein kinase